jgi:hypothetical protein
MIVVKGTNREVDLSGTKPEVVAPATVEAKAEVKPTQKPEVKMADKPEAKPAAPAPQPAPAGARKVVEVKGTNREVTLPGTKTESAAEPAKMAPNKPNDTRPSIPLNPPMVNDAPPSPAPAKKPTS